MAMKYTEFYSVVKKQRIVIPKANIRETVRKGRRFAVGKYNWKGKEYEAWKILGKA